MCTKTRLLPGTSPPGPPPMFRPAPIRGLKAVLKPLALSLSPHQNYPSYAPGKGLASLGGHL